MATARELDPVSLILITLESGYLLGQGKREQGLARLKQVFEIEPDFWVAHLTLAGAQLADKEVDRAVETLRHADRLADGSTQASAVLGLVLARNGRTQEAQAVLQTLLSAEKTRYVPPTSIETVYAGLGESEAALAALERAYTVRDTRLAVMKTDARWTSLSKQPRFIALLEKMKLGAYQAA